MTKTYELPEKMIMADVDEKHHTATVSVFALDELVEAVNKTGHWVPQDIYNCHTNFKCSECGYIHNFMHLYGKPTADYTYCPNCGCRMVEPQESEDKRIAERSTDV